VKIKMLFVFQNFKRSATILRETSKQLLKYHAMKKNGEKVKITPQKNKGMVVRNVETTASHD